MTAKFVGACSKPSNIKDLNKPEIAIVGRSNVGKSTLINALAKANIARTSKLPGRTRLINYFDFEKFCLVDLPGYGFAKANKTEQAGWQSLIESYLLNSKNLAHVLVLVDSRLDVQDFDVQMINFLFYHSISFSVVATKIDKLVKSKRIHSIRNLASGFKLGIENIFPVSANLNIGLESLYRRIIQFVDLGGKNV